MTHWKKFCLQHVPKGSKPGVMSRKARLTHHSNLLAVAVIHATTRSHLWEKGFISSCAPRLQSIMKGNHGKELKHKLEAEAMGASFTDLLDQPFYTANHLPRGATTHRKQSPPAARQ